MTPDSRPQQISGRTRVVTGRYRLLMPGTSSRNYRLRYTVLGLLLATGAPTGALLIRQFSGVDPAVDLVENAFFYLYDFIVTAIVFAVGGYVAGRRADTLERDRNWFLALAEHDELTQLLNSRAFWDRYRRAVERVARTGEPLSMLMIDLDHLKILNDEEGHAFGNAALQAVSRVITSVKRAEDHASRWGGDEFVLLMPGADEQAAARVAESILEAVTSQPVFAGPHRRYITVTVGVATEIGASAERLFECADAALLAGKRAGRNRVQRFSEIE